MQSTLFLIDLVFENAFYALNETYEIDKFECGIRHFSVNAMIICDMSTIADIKDPSFVIVNEVSFHHPLKVSNANFLLKMFKNNFFEEIYIFRRITDILCYSFRFLLYQPTFKTILIWNLYSKLILFLESPAKIFHRLKDSFRLPT